MSSNKTPGTGGRFIRDRKTGKLSPAPKPQPPAPPAASPAPASAETATKGK